MKKAILVLDDEPMFLMFLKRFVEDLGYDCITFKRSEDVLNFLNNKDPIKNINSSDVVISIMDLSMSYINNTSMVKLISCMANNIKVIVLTANNQLSGIAEAMSDGASEYVAKGNKDLPIRLFSAINHCVENRNLKLQINKLERKNDHRVSFSDLIGISDIFINCVNLAKKLSNLDVPILIEGGFGSGKEFLAKAIHGSSNRVGKNFIGIDCNFLSKDIRDTKNSGITLFGSEKFEEYNIKEKVTGAIQKADGGTLFLGNVDCLPLDIQLKLLRFIQERSFEPFFSNKHITSSARIIVSSNKSLETCVRQSKFREDLYYCLGGGSFLIDMPSLSQRGKVDIKLLAENFLFQFAISENKKVKLITEEALELLYGFVWEDNVQELKEFVFRAVLLCDDKDLKPEHFPQALHFASIKQMIREDNDDFKATLESVELFNKDSTTKDLEEIETEMVKKLVEYYNGNITSVSKHLKIGRSTVYRKLNPEINE